MQPFDSNYPEDNKINLNMYPLHCCKYTDINSTMLKYRVYSWILSTLREFSGTLKWECVCGQKNTVHAFRDYYLGAC